MASPARARATTPRTPRKTTATPRAKQSRPKDYITFQGQKYQVADKIGIWPLLQFARAAETGLSASDSRGLAAAHAFLQDVIHADDWGRFQEDMITSKLTDLDGLMEAARQGVEMVAKRQNKPARGRAAGNVVQGAVDA